MTPSSEHPVTVLVLAVGGNVSQGILKALAESSLHCRIIGSDVSALQMGLHTVNVGYIAPLANDPNFLQWLIDICKREDVNIILSGCEPVIAVLAKNREFIETNTNAVCPVNSMTIMEICDDKMNTCDWLKEKGIAYPDYAASEDVVAVKALAERSGFPLIAKLRVGGGGQNIVIINDDEDINYISRKDGYVVQEYLGNDKSEYTVGCFSDRDGNLLGTIVLWRELLQGPTYRAVAGDYPDVLQEAECIANALRPIGPCNIQLRITDRGPVCFEINPRFSGTTPIRAHFGFNEADAAVRHFVFQETAPYLPDIKTGIALRYWNEIYIEQKAVHTLENAGRIDNTQIESATIESYGKLS